MNYLESSRILRIATREGGVRSVIAKGVRTSRKRFGNAVDLFAQGTAQLYVKPGRDLDTLSAFDVSHPRPGLALDLDRFSGASAIAELVMRCTRDASDASLFDELSQVLDDISLAAPHDAARVALRGAWRIVAALGVAPSLDACIECGTQLAPDEPARFHHPGGGVLCVKCARLFAGGRLLPPAARSALREWTEGGDAPISEPAELRAHQRLLREFLAEHLADGRPLKAFEAWERGWSAA